MTRSADVVVLDPPRKGCDKILLGKILEVGPERIVYVSYDSATLARDIKILTSPETLTTNPALEDSQNISKKSSAKANYKLIFARPVDMFPNTTHIETVCRLSLIK